MKQQDRVQFLILEDEVLDRKWKIVFNSLLVDLKDVDYEIEFTSRNENSTTGFLTKVLYDSIKYRLNNRIKIANIPDNELWLKIEVFGAVSNHQLFCKRSKMIGKPVLEGDIDTQFIQKDDVFEASSKLRFVDVSSNFNDEEFKFRLSYFLPNDSKDPILIIESAPFFVKARRKRFANPTTRQMLGEPNAKRRRTNDIADYQKEFDNLMNLTKKMNAREKKKAIKLMLKSVINVKELNWLDMLQTSPNQNSVAMDPNLSSFPNISFGGEEDMYVMEPNYPFFFNNEFQNLPTLTPDLFEPYPPATLDHPPVEDDITAFSTPLPGSRNEPDWNQLGFPYSESI